MSGKVALSLRVALITTALGSAVFVVFGRAVEPKPTLPVPSEERPYKPLHIDSISQAERAQQLVPTSAYHIAPEALLDTVAIPSGEQVDTLPSTRAKRSFLGHRTIAPSL
jgi:hypothetical protein